MLKAAAFKPESKRWPEKVPAWFNCWVKPTPVRGNSAMIVLVGRSTNKYL
jgi:hypothetical protein